ncbi:MAG: hypothetical protein KA250_06945 [Verrucomicrobiales bacterium]|jgi:hypothetical protein|nr:hypothetical protein [Verrucomicrobiales bacterium]MBP9224311.1 hypothetical protein [Verrucomicrobiales bacterium]HQZ27500.1 hypothetical protein [Verrucomicrobiales bacterium]
MSPQAIASSLESLRNAGSVFGLILAKGQEVIFGDTSLTPEGVQELAITLDDIAYYFTQEKRNPDQLAFGFDGGSLLILLADEYRLVVFHYDSNELDFVAKAGRAFLKDYLTGLRITEWVAGAGNAPQDERPVALSAG